MFENLYCRAFQTDDSAFDNRKEYFLALLNFISDETLKASVSESVAHYINNNSYLEQSFAASEISDNGVGEFVRSRSRSRETSAIETCYAVVFDGDSGISADKVGESIKFVSDSANGNDKIVLLVALSENSTANNFLKALDASRLPCDVTTYILIKNKYRPEELTDNLCGSLLLNIARSENSVLNENVFALSRYVASNVASFPESGRQLINQKMPRFWTTVSAAYNDEKRKFLKYYFYQLCQNAENATLVDFSHVCSEYYDHQVYSVDTLGWVRRLGRAIDMIPKIQTVDVKQQSSLKSYFGFCYGMNGSDIVDLTMKVNLSKQPKYTQNNVSDAAIHLFRIIEQYGCEDMYEDVKRYLLQYLTQHKDYITNLSRNLKDFIAKDDADEQLLQTYIRMYIEYNTEFRKQEFWTDVFAYVGKNRAVFDDVCKNNRKLYDSLAELKESLSSAEYLPLPVNIYPSFNAYRLVNADKDREICENIKTAYDRYINGKKKEDELLAENVRYSKLFYVNPSFYQDYEYEFTVGGKYTASIKQRIGQYFEFYEFQ